MKTEPRLSGCCPSSAVEAVLRYVSCDLLGGQELQSPQLLADIRVRGWVAVCGNSYWASLAIILPCCCS